MWRIFAQSGPFATIRCWMAAIPFPGGQLFQIHGSKFKLHPVCHLGQASVLGVTHAVLFFRIGKYTLDLLFSQPVQFFVHRHIPDMLRHLHIVLPDMAPHRFLAPGAFGTYPSGRTAFAKISPAFVFPVALPVCGGIMQRTVLRADHIIKVLVIHIHPPGMAVLFGLGTGIASGCPPPLFCVRDGTCIVRHRGNQKLRCRGHCRE